MRPDGSHPPPVQPGHRVGTGGRGGAVGDHETGGGHGAEHGLSDLAFGDRVEAGEGVVEDEEAAVVGERAGQAETLGLAAGVRGVRAGCGVAVGQPADEVVGACRAGGLPDPGGGGASQGDGVLDRDAQQGRPVEGLRDRRP